MMASNLLSRLLPPSTTQSVYETFREMDQYPDDLRNEERAGMLVDEENLGGQDPGIDAAMSSAMISQPELEEVHTLLSKPSGHSPWTRKHPQWFQNVPDAFETDEAEDEVPQSLLFEGGTVEAPLHSRSAMSPGHAEQQNVIESPVSGRRSGAKRSKRNARQEQSYVYGDVNVRPGSAARPKHSNPLLMMDPKEKAMWRWANVQNLDSFMMDVYEYYVGNGIYSILLSRTLHLFTIAFVVGFGTFLTLCIDYSKIPHSTTMNEILTPRCMSRTSGFWSLLIWVTAVFWIFKLFQYVADMRRLRNMRDFFHHLLDVPDIDIQTITWQEVVKRLMTLRDSNPSTAANVPERHRRFLGSQSKQRMDAHDIANRLMRRDNYLIAMINKEVLDLTLPIPLMRNKVLFSKTLEWHLSFVILDFFFSEQGQVRQVFLDASNRRRLSESLQTRFIVAGFISLLCAPFLIVYLSALYFFRYFNEYQKNPSSISSRQYTPFAEWKFREFNELWHLFERRLNMSYPFASRYVNQFPKDKTVQLARFVGLIAGALASVLAVASILDPENFLGFEITPNRTVLFYLGIFGAVWAAARGVESEDSLVFDPELALRATAEYTHYLPSHWEDRLHSDGVRQEFSELYRMRVLIFLEEIVTIMTTPLLLWFSLPKCSDRLVDFFREFTIHVDGLGYVCSFAVFDFKKGGNDAGQRQQQQQQQQGAQAGTDGPDLRDDYYSTRDGKMLASYYNFVDNYVTGPSGEAEYRARIRQRFHPPPAFPGLAASNAVRDGQMPAPGKASSRAMATQRAPGFAPGDHSQSPMASVLLDPAHQPSASMWRGSNRSLVQSRMRNVRRPMTDVIEDEEDRGQEQGARSDGRGSGSAEAAGSGDLGDSWKLTRAGAVDDEDDGDGDSPNLEGGAGVLGLVYQFSRAQTEGRGAGVQI